ncbi:MAG: carboxylesterase family protein, partial [Tissierellia bacterium]|nr:carboxylesterase family protein [Tissierellia bacterium]
KWISENIEIFGGDPNNIVLSGQSNGALSVLVQLCIKENEELFNRAILMSPAFPEIRSVEVAKQMSDKALINSGIRSLEYASLKDILKIKDNFMNLVIDDELFKDDILNILKKGDFIKMPILVGTCSDEFSIYDNFLFRYFLGIKSDEKHSEKKYRKYFGNYYDEFMMILKEKKDDISQIQIKMLGYIFHKSALQIMEYFSIYSDVYAYYSEFAPTVFGKKNGAYHGSDISMLFDNLEVEDSIYKLESNIFRDDIISFIKYGKIDGYPVYKKDSRNIRIYSNKSKKDIEYPNFNLLWSMIQDGVFEKLFDDIFSKFRNR